MGRQNNKAFRLHYRNVVSRLQGKKVFFEEASVWPWVKSVRSQINSHEGEKEGIGEQVGRWGSREKSKVWQ